MDSLITAAARALAAGVRSLALVLALATAVVIGTLATPRHRGPRSDHFDGERFHNLMPLEQPRAGLRLTSVPAQHFSNRSITDRNRALWTGFVIQGAAGAVYFAGDTALGPHFEQIRNRLGPVRLALLPIGAFRPEWFMSPVHLSPSEALRAHQFAGAATSVAIHFGTFQLGDDGIDEPIQLLQLEMQRLSPPPRFWVLGFGEGRDVPVATLVDGESSSGP